MEDNHNEYTGAPPENNIYSDFMAILDNYENLYESNNNLIIEEENVKHPQTKQKKFQSFCQNFLEKLNIMSAKLK